MARRARRDTAQDRATAAETLRAVPYRNEAMRTTPRRGGGLLVAVPMRHPRFLVPPLSWILPYSSQRRVELDAVGAWVLNRCDGHHTVEAIIEAFADEHRLSFREAQLPVTQFLKQLTQRGLIAIVGTKGGPDQP